MYDRFVCYHKTSTNLNCLCSKHHSSCKSSSICNTTGRNYRNIDCIHYLWHQCHSRSRTNMSAAFHAFCYNGIGSGSFHQFCHSNTCHNRNHLNSCGFPHIHIFTGVACARGNNLYSFVYDHLCNRIRFRVHQHDIYTKWLICQFFRLFNLLSYKFCRSSTGTNDTQSTGIGDCGSKIMLRNPCHSPLNNWIFNI